MNRSIYALTFASLLIGILASGCVGKEETIPNPVPTPSTSTTAKGNALGTEAKVEHYNIKLEADPAEPKVGKVKFIATVLHHGTPTDVAKVKLTTFMAGMGHAGPESDMKLVGGGVYSAEVELLMEGEIQAKITVDQEGHTGEATFDFVAQKQP